MLKIPEFIKNFLDSVGRDPDSDVAPVPKSIACGQPGDFLLFNYNPKYSSRAGWRVVLITQPVVKAARTGNLLLTGFDVPPEGEYTPESLITLYTNKELDVNSYRTYILTEPHTVDSLYRITRKQ